MIPRVKTAGYIVAILIFNSVAGFAQSPYTLSWELEQSIAIPGAAGILGGYIAEHSIHPLTMQELGSLSRASVNSFDRSATFRYSQSSSDLSNAVYGVAAVVPCVLFSDNNMRKDWQTISVMYLETLEWYAATTMIAKGTIKRNRPFVYNPDVSTSEKTSRDARESFFSGHTTLAFASAVFASTVYSEYHTDSPWKPYIWAGSLAIASSVGYLRYASGQHYPTDIITGAIIGSGLGYIIPWLHKTQTRNVDISMGLNENAPCLSIGIKF